MILCQYIIPLHVQIYHYNDTHKRTRTINPSSLSKKFNHKISAFLFLNTYSSAVVTSTKCQYIFPSEKTVGP